MFCHNLYPKKYLHFFSQSDSLIAHYGAGGVIGTVRWAGAPPHADTHAPGRPVDQGEEGVVDAEYDGQVGVVDVDGAGGHHDVYQTGHGVQAV